MKLVKTCCCFYSLKTGTLATGCFTLLLSISAFIGFTWLLSEQYSRIESFSLFASAFFGASAGAAIGVFVSVFLLVGTVKGYKWLLLPWITYTLVGIPIVIPFVVLMLRFPSWLFILLLVSFLLILIPLHFYLILVVISHFEELSEENDRQERIDKRF